MKKLAKLFSHAEDVYFTAAGTVFLLWYFEVPASKELLNALVWLWAFAFVVAVVLKIIVLMREDNSPGAEGLPTVQSP